MPRAPALAGLLALLAAAPVAAITGIGQEEDVSELLVTRPEEDGDDEAKGRRWAIVPQVGYGPDTGPLGGLKFTHRDLLGSGITFDVEGDYSLNQQQSLGLTVGAPDVLDDRRFLLLLSVGYDLDPQRDFFGLGNNDVGPDAASTHEERDIGGELTLGWRARFGATWWSRRASGSAIWTSNVAIGTATRRSPSTCFRTCRASRAGS